MHRFWETTVFVDLDRGSTILITAGTDSAIVFDLLPIPPSSSMSYLPEVVGAATAAPVSH